MIVSRDINPKRDFYYLGGKILGQLAIIDGDDIDFLILFESIRKQDVISMNLFVLTLDWLFLLGAIEENINGNIKKCF